MYSLLPIIVATLFLSYGLYVVTQRGFNRFSTSFFLLCVTTFFWQATWAVLFQVKSPEIAGYLIKFGYLLILFLPTSLYLFLTEISERKGELRWVYTSYALAASLAVVLLTSDYFVAGYYQYFFGYYPKAGLLHPIHVLQTVVVVSRGLYITYRQQQVASTDKKSRLRLCIIISLLVYFFAAIDYLCNYGIEFYPPGVVFTTISLGIIAIAIEKYELMNSVTIASSVAHEMRTPLATIRFQAEILGRVLPDLLAGYQLAVQNKLWQNNIAPAMAGQLQELAQKMTYQIDRSNVVIDMFLAAAKMERIDVSAFKPYSVKACVIEAIESYPFLLDDRQKVDMSGLKDFTFYGSDNLLVFVIFNLIKNSLYAMKAANKGTITITTKVGTKFNWLVFTDTGSGIPPDVLPRIFDTFFTANKTVGTGIGLAFCKNVIQATGGTMRCDSELGKYATFTLEFPALSTQSSINAQQSIHSV